MTYHDMVSIIALYNGNVCGPKLKLLPEEKEALAHLRSLLADGIIAHRNYTIAEQQKIAREAKKAGKLVPRFGS